MSDDQPLQPGLFDDDQPAAASSQQPAGAPPAAPPPEEAPDHVMDDHAFDEQAFDPSSRWEPDDADYQGLHLDDLPASHDRTAEPDLSPGAVPAELTAGLNDQQAEAVRTLVGPLVVVAGPGSGKTRVLTHRVAALLAAGVPAWRILAVTFTNKAASEMRTRLDALVGTEAARPLWVATFHSVCVRILRANAAAAGLRRDFSIADADDAVKLLGRALERAGQPTMDRKELRSFHAEISRAKNQGRTVAELAAGGRGDKLLADMMRRYADELDRVGALDFDDLLLRCLDLLESDPEVRARYQAKFSHVLVDEYQDTNPVQYRIVQLIAQGSSNLMVVGDADQCHPATTRVLRGDGTWARVDELSDGDLVHTCDPDDPHALAAPHPVRVASRPHHGHLRVVAAGGRRVEVTPQHRMLVSLRLAAQADTDPAARAAVLLRNAGRDWWLEQVVLDHPAAATCLAGHRTWLLACHRDVATAEDHLLRLADTHQLAHTAAAVTADPDAGPAAHRLLAALGLDPDRPLLTGQDDHDSPRLSGRQFQLPAADLVDHAFHVPVLDPDPDASPWPRLDGHDRGPLQLCPATVSDRPHTGMVYSLEVATHGTYLADHVGVHNSIYAFRSATPQFMQGFTDDWPDATVVTLDRNYRSTANILATVRSIIAANPARYRPALTTDAEPGPPVRVHVAHDDRAEAAWVVDAIADAGRGPSPFGPSPTSLSTDLSDHAILVRTHAQTRVIEERLKTRNLPYDLVGALKFYDRAEVKDALAYLRTAANPFDAVAFARAVTTPKRGIGPAALAEVDEASDRLDTPGHLIDACRALATGTTQKAATLGAFAEVIDQVRSAAATGGPAEALKVVLSLSGLRGYHAKDELAETRLENLAELVSSAATYVTDPDARTTDGTPVVELEPWDQTLAYLANVALVAAGDDVDDDAGHVQVVTAHASKGREWPHVWVVGVEEDFYPHSRSVTAADVAEERRLLFVACSRAEQTLAITRASQRVLFGGPPQDRHPSPFLEQLPTDPAAVVSTASTPPRATTSSWGSRRRGGYRSSSSSGSFGSRSHRSSAASASDTGHSDEGDDEIYVGAIVRHPDHGLVTVERLANGVATVKGRGSVVQCDPSRLEPL